MSRTPRPDRSRIDKSLRIILYIARVYEYILNIPTAFYHLVTRIVLYDGSRYDL